MRWTKALISGAMRAPNSMAKAVSPTSRKRASVPIRRSLSSRSVTFNPSIILHINHTNVSIFELEFHYYLMC